VEWEDEEDEDEEESLGEEDGDGPGEEETPNDEAEDTNEAEYDILDNEILATLPIESKDSCTKVLREILEILEIEASDLR
jgi:hypothetical protein